MTLTEALERWVREAERMEGGEAAGLVVTADLLATLAAEQQADPPAVAGLTVLPAATESPPGMPPIEQMIEIAGPDRVSVYVGADPAGSPFPLGLDPAMPVVFVPLPPAALDTEAELEMYNRLRWYGLGPDEALRGSRQQ
ncbi:MAG TPA: hypothetical protein VFJ85_04430 [Acidimicrobiales bacterium]|nr:hypothetical protein [Acidimicrobiales bacterium]